MLLRLCNLLTLVVFAWWATGLVRLDPLLLEWIGHLLGS